MRGTIVRRIFQFTGYIFSLVSAFLLVAWFLRGIRPSLECGIIEASKLLDWSAFYECLDQADYDPLVGLLALIAGALSWFATRFTLGGDDGEHEPTPEERIRNRIALANRVQKTWIDGVLDRSLHQSVLIALGWESSPDSVAAHPWSSTAGMLDEYNHYALSDENIPQLFDRAEGALLILGDPGSGKTTVLLDLTRTLLALRTIASPVPMVFNLSTWPGMDRDRDIDRKNGKERPFEAWLVGEMHRFYAVPETTAHYLVEHDELMLMLDGLDEVRPEMRQDCIIAINDYRERHLAPMAVCCRTSEYAALKTKLAAHAAVTLQPLTDGQTQDYLAGIAVPEAGALRAALVKDEALRELASSPLMLSLMLGAGKYMQFNRDGESPAELRSAIWDAYLHNMLSRERKVSVRYPAQRIVQSLSWLARKMQERSQTVFLVEQLEADWFNNSTQEMLLGAALSLFVLLSAATIGGAIGGVSGAMIACVVWTFIFVKESRQPRIYEDIRPRGDPFAILVGVVFGLVFGFMGAAIGVLLDSMQSALIHQKSLVSQLGAEVDLAFHGAAFFRGLVIGLFIALIYGLISGTTVQYTTRHLRYYSTKPNSGVRQHLLVSVRFGLIVGAVVGVLWYVFEDQIGQFAGISVHPVVVGLSAILMTLLSLDLHSVVSHYVLRILLWYDNAFPIDYVRFLDHCVERVFLRRVGGGYIFIHRTFMEHLASIDPSNFTVDSRTN